MLIHIKNKQSKFASLTLSVFFGSWLLLLCQTCFATNNDINSQHESSSEIPVSCHTPEDIVLEEVNIEDKEHCYGVCDCDAITVTVQTEKNSELKENIKFKADVVAITSPKASLSNRAPPGSLYSSSPERAIKPPFYTYNVLLI
jgi:hypothetical protein